MVKKKSLVTVLGTVGIIIFLAGLFTPLGLGAPGYALFWALVCWIIAGAIRGTIKDKKKAEVAKPSP